jgi:hypothetical protein
MAYNDSVLHPIPHGNAGSREAHTMVEKVEASIDPETALQDLGGWIPLEAFSLNRGVHDVGGEGQSCDCVADSVRDTLPISRDSSTGARESDTNWLVDAKALDHVASVNGRMECRL